MRFALLASGLTRNGAGPLGWSAAARYVVRSVRYFGTIRSWLADRRNPALQEALAVRPSLVRCVARPYLNSRWPPLRRMDAIRTHYSMLRGRLAFLRFHPYLCLPLADVDEQVRVSLEKATWFEHEGEITLSLFCDGTRVYSLAFTLGESAAGTVAYVGAIQGLGTGDALAIYRALTRRMHGLRPRDLLISVFRMLCAALEVKRILAVSDVACVGRSGCFGPGVGVLSSYDRAWTENGGAPGADGFFELAPRPARRALAEVPSRKRAEHRRRFVMLDELADRIQRAVEHASATFQAPKGAAAETNRPPSDSWSGDFAISAFSRF